jgi:hypothetical protein
MKKYYNLIMWILIYLGFTILVFGLTGCANLDMVEQNKADAEYRKATQEYVVSQKSKTQDNQLSGPIEMPQEWMDQWEQRQVEEQIENSIIGVHNETISNGQ